jgi:hypothetical protein
METAFAAAKKALVAAVPLSHPLPGAVLSLAADASDTHVGSVLQQQVGQHWQPLGFFSKKLSKSEVNYYTFDRELLAPVSGIKHFRSRLEGRPFQLWTDHKPLIFALHRVSPPTSGRQQRHLAFISEYTNQLKYLLGTSNVVADALSHPAAAAAGVQWVCAAVADKSPLDLKDMALRQILCPQVQALRSSLGLHIITQKVGDLDLIGDSSTGTFRPLVPRDLAATGIRTPPWSRPPWQAGDSPPHLFQVCMERSLHRGHSLGKGLPRLPAGQNSPPCTGTSSTHSSTLSPFQPHSGGPGGAPVSLQGVHLPTHYH